MRPLLLILVLSASALAAREPEPRPQDWAFHVWMAKVAEVATQQGFNIEDAECDFTAFWEESTPDNQAPSPEVALVRHKDAIEALNKSNEEEQSAFDKWWSEVKATAPAYGYLIDDANEAMTMELFWHHGFHEGQTPGQAIVVTQERDALRDIKEAQEAVFGELEKQAALAHGLTAEETETFLEWTRWQRDENAETPHTPHAMSGEEMFEAWQHNLEENECGP